MGSEVITNTVFQDVVLHREPESTGQTLPIQKYALHCGKGEPATLEMGQSKA